VITLDEGYRIPRRFFRRSDGHRLSLPFGKSEVIGPGQTRQFVLPYTVTGQGFYGVIPTSMVRGIFYSVAMTKDGRVRVICFNASGQAQWFGPQSSVAAAMLLPETRLELRSAVGQEARVCAQGIDWSKEAAGMIREFSRVIHREGPFDEEKTRVFTIRSKEIQWRVPLDQIPRLNRGVQYQNGELSRAEVTQHLRRLEERNLIRRVGVGEPIFYSPVMFLRKPSGKIRTVQDFRLLNSYSEPWRSVFPGTLETLRRVDPGWAWFTVLDLADGFWNLPVERDLQDLFGFEAGGAAYTWRRLPQGWNSAPGLFQIRMTQVFSDIPHVIVYMDDLLVGSADPREHQEVLKEVLRRMEAVGLQTNPDKAQWCQRTVKYLGYEVSQGQVSLREYVQSQCHQLPQVSSRREIRRILGIMNLCRPCCRNLAEIVAPLQEAAGSPKLPDRVELERMTRKAWAEILSSHLQISLAVPGQELYLECDWSQTGKGYVLYSGRPSEGRIVAINSRRHSEKGLSSYLGELKTIRWALSEIKQISAGLTVHLFTDSQSSALRLTGTPSADDLMDSRVARAWAWILENYLLSGRLKISFIPGLTNSTADALSRWTGGPPVIKVTQIAAGEDQIKQIHGEGHWGTDGTEFRLRERGLTAPRDRIRRVVQGCEVCARFRSLQPTDPLGEPPHSIRAGEVLFFDVIGPVRPGRGGVRYIFNLIDSATRWSISRAAKEVDGVAVVRCLEDWIHHRGPFQTLVSDGASYNQSKRVRNWCQALGVKQIFSPPHSHKSLGLVERYHRTLLDRIRKMAFHRGGSWSDHLQSAVEELNTMKHSTTQMTPVRLWEASEEELEEARERSRRRRTAAKSRRIKEVREFKTGDQVLLWDAVRAESREDKFSVRWIGPFILDEQVSDHLWRLRGDRPRGPGRRPRMIYHSDHLRPFPLPPA